jgi:hypothetical protein
VLVSLLGKAAVEEAIKNISKTSQNIEVKQGLKMEPQAKQCKSYANHM